MQRKRNPKSFTAAGRAEYREAKRAEQRERLEEAVAELASSEGWRRWCESRAMFHRYSFGNTLLIAAQRPDATMVASYATWKRAGRQVRRGERGIVINVPMPVRVRSSDQRDQMAEQVRQSKRGLAPRPGSLEAGEPGDGGTRLLFKAGHVFDVAQTDGQELPTLERHPIEGDSHARYIGKLEAFAQSIGFRVEWRDLSDNAAGGWCDSAAKLIVADSSVPANARVRVLVHELAHALGVGYAEYGRELAEVIVECAAVVVCGSIGLDTSGESVPYMTGWANGDAAKIREYAAAVDGCARKIEDALDIDESLLYGDES